MVHYRELGGSDIATEWKAESLLELSRSFQNSQALLAAAELGVFPALGSQAKAADELAVALDTDPRATEVLLNALVGAGLVDKSGESFSLCSELVPLLSRDADTTVLPMILHMGTCAHRWDKLADVVRTGKCASPVSSMLGAESSRNAFIQAMHVVGRNMAGPIIADTRPERFGRALDVGGASGTYTIALLRANPEMRVTLFDLPPVIEMARERLDSEGLLDRVDLVAGDFYEDPLPTGHDMVLLSAIIHQNGRDQNRELYAKCLVALEAGGTIIIRDIVMDDSHTQPAGGTQFAINMLVATDRGGTYSLAEIRDDLEAVGFADIELIRRGTWMDGLIEAVRPG